MYVYVGQAKSFSLQNYFLKMNIFKTFLCAMPRTKRPLLKTRCKTKLENHVNLFLKNLVALRDDDMRVMHLRTC